MISCLFAFLYMILSYTMYLIIHNMPNKLPKQMNKFLPWNIVGSCSAHWEHLIKYKHGVCPILKKTLKWDILPNIGVSGHIITPHTTHDFASDRFATHPLCCAYLMLTLCDGMICSLSPGWRIHWQPCRPQLSHITSTSRVDTVF